MGYRIIDHTADLGIEVRAAGDRQLFSQCAQALFDLLWDPATVHAVGKSQVQIRGMDRPDLMVNWLRELLFYWTGRQRLIKKVTLLELAECLLSAEVGWENYDPRRHRLRHEIKAVTYHQLAAGPGEKAGDPWRARIIFDL
ncbi:MAG: archease [Desulfobacterales bacterium]